MLDLTIKPSGKEPLSPEDWNEIKENTTSDVSYRGIRPETNKKFGVRYAVDEEGSVLTQYCPITKGGELVGLKRRDHPKEFSAIALTGAECDLFMQHRFKTGGKYVVLTEGEIDALSAYQMINDYNKSRGSDFETAVVSATTGANSYKQIAAQYKFFDSFENIILCLDNDEAGKEAQENIVKVLPKGKVKIMTLKFKDPNEYLKRENSRDFISAFYDAQPYVPLGVVGSGSLYDAVVNQALMKRIPFPPFMQELNVMFCGGIPLGHIINLAAGTGVGKCLGKGTPVRMSNHSVKNVEDIRNGDQVLGPDGNPRIVKGVTSGVDKLYRIDQVKGESYIVNSAHILSFRASTSFGKYKQGQIVNINVEEFANSKGNTSRLLKGWKPDFHQIDDDYFNHELYIIGLWLAEGSRGTSNFTLANKDAELFDSLSKYCADKGFTISVYASNYRENCTTYSVVGGFRDVLDKYGVRHHKQVPIEVLNGTSVSDKLSLLAGFIDGDGYLHNNCFDMTLVDDILSEQLVDLSRACGIGVTSKLVTKKWQNGIGTYRKISLYGNVVKVPNVLSRKKAAPRNQIKNPLNTGVTVTPIGEGEYFGFELEGSDKLFCLGDYTVTHNTTFVNEIIYDWIFSSPHMLGIVSLELDKGQYGEALLSRHLQRKIALFSDEEARMRYLTSEDVRNKATELFMKDGSNHRFYVLDNRDGSVEEIQSAIEELIVACGCRVIVLDPLQDIMAGISIEKQEEFMQWMKGMIKSHKVSFILINHVRKSATGSANTNGEFNEEDIQGSSTIIKSASANILLHRNKNHEDPVMRNTTKVMLPKNRITGITGPAGEIYYDNETHTLYSKAAFFNT